jgi:hypothetical protein
MSYAVLPRNKVYSIAFRVFNNYQQITIDAASLVASSRRNCVAILLIWSVLLGTVLGRFFKVLVLVPACAFILAVVLVRSASVEHGPLRPLLEFAVLITSLQIGYVSGLLFHSQRVATPRKTRPCASSATPIAATRHR